MQTQTTQSKTEPVLAVRDLGVAFDTREGVVHAVNGISLEVYPGEVLGIAGESGSGKSVSMMAALGLVPTPPGRITSGEVIMGGKDLVKMSKRQRRGVLARDLSIVFQDPMTSLNPVLTVGKQIREALQSKNPNMSNSAAHKRSAELLALVGVPDAERRTGEYPHQYSGGMRQRAMIAMAIANEPKLLIADEPTTALDVTIQAQVIEVLKKAQQETGSPLIMITHDLALMAELADRIVVMYGGRVVETGTVHEIFANPQHPYTIGLLASVPRMDSDTGRLVPIAGQPPSAIRLPKGCAFHQRCRLYQGREECHTEVPELHEPSPGHLSACHFYQEVPEFRRQLGIAASGTALSFGKDDSRPAAAPERKVPSGEEVLRVEGLKVHFPIRSAVLARHVGDVRAVDGVDLTLHAGETLGLVGESGCGKTTTGKTLMGLIEPTDGRIFVRGERITAMKRSKLRALRKEMQIVFQDPYSSLDPRMSVKDIISEPMHIHGEFKEGKDRQRVEELMELVGLKPEHATRYAHEFSGGQRQRIGIARALALNPKILILDEPVSALDVSIQAQVINLLMDLQEELGLTYLFIAHDLAVVRQIAHRVAVMYLGKVVEVGERNQVFDKPVHPYTQALLSAVPIPDPAMRDRMDTRIVLKGDVPNPSKPPPGCNFQTRCFKMEPGRCDVDEPELDDRFGHGHPSACFYSALREEESEKV